MKEYTLGKKASAIVFHQLFTVLTSACLYTMDYFIARRMPENGMIFSMLSIAGLVGGFIALAYLTNAAGRKSEEDTEVSFNVVDRIYGDILTAVFIFLVWSIVHIALKLRFQAFTLAGLLVAVGTLSYLLDAVFLLFYLSIVRRVKGDILFRQTFFYQVYRLFAGVLGRKRKSFVRILIYLAGAVVLPAAAGIFVWYHINWGIAVCVLLGIAAVYLFLRRSEERYRIREALEAVADGALDTKLQLEAFHGQEKELAEAVNNIRAGLSEAVTESIRNERMKADLITNVSHDIKTPLTSIINYVDLLKRENLENENAQNYIRILDAKSQRLKQLTEDLVEASKISSGNVQLDMQRIDLVELIYQIGGEFNEKFETQELTVVTKLPNGSVMIEADGRQLYRAIENLYINVAKYAMEKTRVFVEVAAEGDTAVFSIKNITRNPILFRQEQGMDLSERFVRGEASRTTEGSGLGLSIAKNLTFLMGGSFHIEVNGDLFIVTLAFKIA